MATTHKLNSFPAWMAYPETLKLLEALKADNTDAPRFVGGCVRDALVNEISFDIDIATPLEPTKIIEQLNKAEIKSVPTGIKHGTVTAIVDKMSFEITTLRRDVETYGRHAKVAFTDSWEKDAGRRDFTINALFCDIDGTVYDFWGGVRDLRQGIVKFIGNAEDRIEEDILRILRFFRFYSRFGIGEPDEEALQACTKFACKIPTLSKERITNEFLLFLTTKNLATVIKYMQKTGVIAEILPAGFDIENLKNLVEVEIKFDAGIDAIRRLFALTGEKDTPYFRLSNIQKKHLKALKDTPYINADTSKKQLRYMIYELSSDIVRDKLLLSVAKDMESLEQYKDLYQTATAWQLPKFQLVGNDVITLGISEGKKIGAALKTVEKWWAENDFKAGRTDCLIKLRQVVKRIQRGT